MCIFDLINLLPSARCTYVDRRAICIKTLSSIVNLNDKQKYCIQYVQCVSMNSKIAVTNRTHSCVNMYVCNRKLHYILHIILLGMYLPDSINTSSLHWNIWRLLQCRAHNDLSITTLACTIGAVRISKIAYNYWYRREMHSKIASDVTVSDYMLTYIYMCSVYLWVERSL